MNNIVVVDCIRTGLAKAHRGTFNMSRSDDLVAHCINALLDRNPSLDPALVEDVILGCGRQVGEQSANVARHAVALSNLPITVPATTISRACSSGLNSIAFAASQINSGFAEIMMAGGVE
ncbi:MAG: beta-ketoacyl synthase N-terminal-like domain-containing protein, partial [Pseudomonadales bacterium]|nr:beta-ketoacyl synthase N-terminal-like domain-containing protein [Pseudomonadales bacterium]